MSLNGAGVPVLEARGLSAGYGSLAAVREIDLHMNAGEVVALLGANGAGKTTTILTLAGELAPLGGEVWWRGAVARPGLARRTRSGLGLVLEERSVFTDLTVAENLNIGLGPAEAALELFPELKPHFRRRAGLLSGGQQQMLTLARALAARPHALLIDELSLGLAPVLVERLIESVRECAQQGIGVLLVEQHVRRALAVADRAYVLRRGRVVLDGDADDLVGRIDEVESMYFDTP
jgi:branched-chain amino acid transport system ATP-binding protein